MLKTSYLFLELNFFLQAHHERLQSRFKSFVRSKDGQFLTSGSKNIEDKIIIGDEFEVFIWGVVTYVIH